MAKTGYSVVVTRNGMDWFTPGYTESRREAVQIAKREANSRRGQGGVAVYIEVYRPSDGQKMYLNPGGDFDLTGRAW